MSEIFDKVVEAVQRGLFELFENPEVLIMQLLATIVLFIVIRIFLWKPITAYIEKNQEATNRELTEAYENSKKARELKNETLKEYEEAKEEIKTFKELLQQEAYDEKDRIITEAREEAQRRLNQVELDIKQEIKQSNEKVKASIKEIAFAAAEKILQHEIDEEQHEKMIDDLIEGKFND